MTRIKTMIKLVRDDHWTRGAELGVNVWAAPKC